MTDKSSTAECAENARDFSQPWDGSDVTFLVEDKKLYGNRVVLGMWSPVFKSMLSGDFKESNMEVIPLPGKKFEDIVQLLDVTHPPHGNITWENVETILQLSREYQIEQMPKMCENFFLSEPPSVRSLMLAEQYDFQTLMKKGEEYAKSSTWTELKKDEFFESAFGKILKEKIAAQEACAATLHKLKDISVIKDPHCSACENTRCVDCGCESTSYIVRNKTCTPKKDKYPFLCFRCSCKRFQNVHDFLAVLKLA